MVKFELRAVYFCDEGPFYSVCSVTWPSNGSEADHVVNQVILMLISWHLNEKVERFCIKARSTPASLAFKGQVTEHTTVKWSIEL